ncbi:MAG TPA: chemotaxis protein CheW, partial [Pyrinomonadaceae bacterium]
NQISHIGGAVREKRPTKKKRTDRDNPQPFDLSELLGQSSAKKRSRKSAQLITCQLSESEQQANGGTLNQVTLIVDEVQGTEEVLVRSLGRHGGRWYGVAGATELRDGRVALVLDLTRLVINS